MRPPRQTLQPIGQQVTEQTAIENASATASMPMTGRVRTRPLPGVVVLPARIARGTS